MAGRFISFEGGEGVGKSTQARLLRDALAHRGIDALLTREPGGSAGAEAIRRLVLEGAADQWSTRTEALLFAAARADHVQRAIKPALEKGQWVICDRFIDSSRAYQGGAAGLIADEDILSLHEFGCRGFLPDRTILLTMPVVDAEERIVLRDGGDRDRIASRSIDYHMEVAMTFLAIAQAEPKRVRSVDANGKIADVHQRVMKQIGDLLP